MTARDRRPAIITRRTFAGATVLALAGGLAACTGGDLSVERTEPPETTVLPGDDLPAASAALSAALFTTSDVAVLADEASLEALLPRLEGFPAPLSAWTEPLHIANLLFLGLLASATCFVTWNRAVFLLGPVKTSAYIYATPVITIVSSAIVLHETMTPVMWLGTALALAGLILSEHKEKEKAAG